MLGSIGAGWLSSAIGRVRCMVLSGLPVIITHIIVAMANSPLMLYLVCFLQGLCQMVAWVTGSVYELAYSYSQIIIAVFRYLYI